MVGPFVARGPAIKFVHGFAKIGVKHDCRHVDDTVDLQNDAAEHPFPFAVPVIVAAFIVKRGFGQQIRRVAPCSGDGGPEIAVIGCWDNVQPAKGISREIGGWREVRIFGIRKEFAQDRTQGLGDFFLHLSRSAEVKKQDAHQAKKGWEYWQDWINFIGLQRKKCGDSEHERNPAFTARDCGLAMCFFVTQVGRDFLVIELGKAFFVIFAFVKCEVFDTLGLLIKWRT
jgi:hypothetical protein